MIDVLYATGERTSAEEVTRVDSAIRAMTEGTAADGGHLVPPQYLQDQFSYDLVSTIAFRQVPGIRWMPVRSNSIVLPRESSPAGASQADEAGTLSVQDATLAAQTIAIEKQYGYRRYSNELLADADPAWNEFLANTLVRDVALQQDIQYLEGSGSAPQIQGLYDYTGNLDVSSGTNGASPDFDLFYDSQYQSRLIGAEPDFVIAHPRVLNSLAKIKDADGNYILSNQSGVNAPGAFGTGLPGAAPKGVILGSIPMWFSSQINIARTVGTSTDCTSVFMGQSNQVIGLERQGIEIAFSEHIYFNTDETAARAIARSAIAVLQPDAVTQINGVRP
jgi:HK97 family phage major capsid protein